MIRTVIAILIIGISSMCYASDDSQEPPLKYTLEINGQQHEVARDKPLQIKGTYNDPKVMLRASTVRYFTYGDIAFQYPASFTWKAKITSNDDKVWLMTGVDFKIMYFILPEVSADAFALLMAKKFRVASPRISDTERTLGGHKYKGKLLQVKLADIAIREEVYALPAKAGSTRLLLLTGANTEEGEKALVIFSKSFKDTMKSNKKNPGDGK